MPKTSKRQDKHLKYHSLLRKMNELKTDLFGQFSPTITKETRRKAWNEVRDHAVSVGLIHPEKDFTYVRDTTWPNLRQRTMAKVDRRISTGEGGGPDSKLDETDLLVLEVVGKDSPIVEGLGIPDTMGLGPINSVGIGSKDSVDNQGPVETDENLEEKAHSAENTSTEKQMCTPHAGSKGFTRKRVIVRNRDESKALENLKKKKLELEIRKLELDVWEKEQILGVAHCTLTSHISSKTLEEEKESGSVVNGTANDLFVMNNAQLVINDIGEIVMVEKEHEPDE